MAKKIYLNGGADIRKNESEDIDRRAFDEAKTNSVFVVNLTTNDKDKILEYKVSLKNYFKEFGAEKIYFATEVSDEEFIVKITNSGLIYLPGGDPDLLMENLRKRQVIQYFDNLDAVIIGNSAGAMVLCSEYVMTEGDYKDYINPHIVKGMGLVDMCIDVHYNNIHDKKLFELSRQRDIYAIPEKSIIVLNNEKLNFIGDVYLFSKGEKIKVN